MDPQEKPDGAKLAANFSIRVSLHVVPVLCQVPRWDPQAIAAVAVLPVPYFETLSGNRATLSPPFGSSTDFLALALHEPLEPAQACIDFLLQRSASISAPLPVNGREAPLGRTAESGFPSAARCHQ